jgi:aryl-alcohol dehydrogenase-like predicted oxidoreductase
MSWLRPLGGTGLEVSALGLGAVKLGRNKGLKYPTGFDLPDDRSAAALLALAQDLGINLIDTAPAYGDSEERLGKLLRGQRQRWLLCSKVGEEFAAGQSRFDFSPEHAGASVRRSLHRLQTEVLDLVLVHSNGADLAIINEMGTLQALQQLKDEGLIRAFGMSTKTLAGGLAAAPHCDVLMLTYNPGHREELPVLDACADLNTAVLIKKALASGHLDSSCDEDPVQTSLELALSHPATSAVVIGTINPDHLRDNVAAARRALG